MDNLRSLYNGPRVTPSNWRRVREEGWRWERNLPAEYGTRLALVNEALQRYGRDRVRIGHAFIEGFGPDHDKSDHGLYVKDEDAILEDVQADIDHFEKHGSFPK